MRQKIPLGRVARLAALKLVHKICSARYFGWFIPKSLLEDTE